MGPLPPSMGGSDVTSISTSECTSQCWNIYFQPEIPDKNIRRGFKSMKINNARLHISNLQIFRQSHSLNCRARLLHWNHSFLLCVYNIQHKWNIVKGFCEKNAKCFSDIFDGKPAMTEAVDGYASYAPKTYLCALGMHKRMRNLYKNAAKNREKVVAWNGKCILTNSAWATMIEPS